MVKMKGITCTEHFVNVVSATEQKMLVTFLKRSLYMDPWFLFAKRHLDVDIL